MSNGLQISLTVLRISRLFSSSTGKRRCGYDVAKSLGTKVSTTYYVLERMQEAGWLASKKIDDDWVHGTQSAIGNGGKLGSRLYQITPMGVQKATQAFAALHMAST